MAVDQKLSPRADRFARLIAADPERNAAKAAREAGYSPRTAGAQGRRLLQDVRVQAIIAEASQIAVIKAQVKVDDVVERLAAIFFGQITDVLTWTPQGVAGTSPGLILKSPDEMNGGAGLIKSIEEKRDRNGAFTGFKVTLHDPLKAGELLGRYLGMFIDRHKIEQDGPIWHVHVPAEMDRTAWVDQYASGGREIPQKGDAE